MSPFESSAMPWGARNFPISRPGQIVPLRLVFAVAVEHLHAVVLAIGDINPSIDVGDDVVDDVELAGIGARLAPCLQQLSIRRVFMDAGVAVTVGYIDIAPG